VRQLGLVMEKMLIQIETFNSMTLEIVPDDGSAMYMIDLLGGNFIWNGSFDYGVQVDVRVSARLYTVALAVE